LSFAHIPESENPMMYHFPCCDSLLISFTLSHVLGGK